MQRAAMPVFDGSQVLTQIAPIRLQLFMAVIAANEVGPPELSACLNELKSANEAPQPKSADEAPPLGLQAGIAGAGFGLRLHEPKLRRAARRGRCATTTTTTATTTARAPHFGTSPCDLMRNLSN